MARLRLLFHYVIFVAAGLPGAMVVVITAVYLVTVEAVDPFVVGLYVNTATILGIIINFYAGRGSLDRHNPTTVTTLAMASTALSVACLLAIPFSVWMLVPATLFRAFSGLLMPAMYMFDEKHRPDVGDPETGMYMTRLTSSVVWILGPPCAFYLFWMGSFPAVATASIGILVAAAVAVIGVSVFSKASRDGAQANSDSATKAPAAHMPIWAVFTAMLMVTGANVLHSVTMPLYLIDELFVPTYWPGWNMTLAAATEVVVIFLIPRMVRHVSEETLLQVGLGMGAIYFALLFLVRSPEIILGLQVLYGAHFALSTVVCLGILKAGSKRKMGSVAAQFVNAGRIGGLLGTTLFALFATHLGYGSLLRDFGLGLILVGGLVSSARWVFAGLPQQP